MRNRLVTLRRKAAHVARFLHLRRLADSIGPPVTPWYLRRPLSYREHFATAEECTPPAASMPPAYDDVTLAYARWMDDGKRAKLLEVAFTEPDPAKAGQAAAELRQMILEGPAVRNRVSAPGMVSVPGLTKDWI